MVAVARPGVDRGHRLLGEVVEEVPDRVLGGEVRGEAAQRVQRGCKVLGGAAIAGDVVGVRRIQV